MGGAIAVKLACSEPSVGAMAPPSPALDFREISVRSLAAERGGYLHFGPLRLKKENVVGLSKVTVMDLARDICNPTLIVHSTDDATVPIAQSRKFCSMLRTTAMLLELERGGHVFEDYGVRREGYRRYCRGGSRSTYGGDR